MYTQLTIQRHEKWPFRALLGVLGQKLIFLTSFTVLTRFRVEMDISYHFHKIRSKCENFSLTFIREKCPISWLSWEKYYSTYTCNKRAIDFFSEDDDWARVVLESAFFPGCTMYYFFFFQQNYFTQKLTRLTILNFIHLNYN